MNQKINLIFMGEFTYPCGMAGTKRIQHAISALKEDPDTSVCVVLQRQSSLQNSLTGLHEGTPYQTVMGDLLRARMVALLPVLYFQTIRVLRKAWHPNCKNVIYHYGPVALDSLVPLYYARHLGYKIVFDIVEDFDVARDISASFWHRVRINCMHRLSSKIRDLASGIIVISSRLQQKYYDLSQGSIPIHYRPISVDLDCFPEKQWRIGSTVSLFYAGSFGRKDGVAVLLDAFDRLAERRGNIRLVLSGAGDSEAMEEFFRRLEMSPFQDRIEYKGYVDDKTYYSILSDVDIPCMTRIDLAFAQAGFPFKLGEFLASGKPVIASRVSDVGLLLQNQCDAMLVEPGDPKQISDAVEYLIEHPEAASAIGSRGRARATSLFDYKAQGLSLSVYLKEL